jgi:LPXTG-motif cell wall-anchored protein
MDQRTRYKHNSPISTSLLTLAMIAGLGLLFWALARKRRTAEVLLSSVVPPPPLVSPWNPLP